jgi:hypothetical protein
MLEKAAGRLPSIPGPGSEPSVVGFCAPNGGGGDGGGMDRVEIGIWVRGGRRERRPVFGWTRENFLLLFRSPRTSDLEYERTRSASYLYYIN